jgi:hypothetical protein
MEPFDSRHAHPEHGDPPVRAARTQRDPGWSDDVNLIVNPTTDAVFEEHARRLAATSADPQALEARLRQHYPQAVVRRRELSGEPFLMWYVYRDGHWSPAGS